MLALKKELIVKNNDLPYEYESLTRSSTVPQITFIRSYWYEEHLNYNEFGNPLSKIIRRHFPQLRTLTFDECELDDTFFRLFSKSYTLRNLTVLKFMGVDTVISFTQVKILMNSKLLSNLDKLWLGPLETHKEVFNVILSSKNLKRLRHLKVLIQDCQPETFSAPKTTPPLLKSFKIFNCNLSQSLPFLNPFTAFL